MPSSGSPSFVCVRSPLSVSQQNLSFLKSMIPPCSWTHSLGFSFSPPVIYLLLCLSPDISVPAWWCQWVPQGRRRAVKWILRTCWFKKDLPQPQLCSGLGTGLWQWPSGCSLPPADNTHSLLATAVLTKFHVPLPVHTCYAGCRRSHWVACGLCRQHLAGTPWPHQSPDVSKSCHFSPNGEASFQCHFSS